MTHIPVMRPRLPRAERLLPYLQQIDASRIYTNHGPLVAEFQDRICDLLGLSAGTFVSAASGTSAIAGALLARCGRAHEERPLVLLPAFTFVATAIAVEECGYWPYLADVGAVDWMLDPNRLATHPELGRIAAVIPVAPFGRGVLQDPWRRFQEATGIPVIIDGAASFDVVAAGGKDFLGDIPVTFSFHATKSLSSAEGGGVVTTETGLSERATQALNFGFSSDRNSRSASINGKMSEYHAAVGLAEIDGWQEKHAALRAIAHKYGAAARFAGIAERLIAWPEISTAYVLFRAEDADESSRVQNALKAASIDFRFWYGEGVHRQHYFSASARDTVPTSEHLGETLVGLPVAPDLNDETILRIVEVLAKTLTIRA